MARSPGRLRLPKSPGRGIDAHLAQDAAMPKPYLRNLLSIISVGVLVSGWLLYYTDWFEVVGGLLALGGILSWLAFVSKILPDERIKQLQKRFDDRVLCNARTWRRALVVLL